MAESTSGFHRDVVGDPTLPLSNDMHPASTDVPDAAALAAIATTYSSYGMTIPDNMQYRQVDTDTVYRWNGTAMVPFGSMMTGSGIANHLAYWSGTNALSYSGMLWYAGAPAVYPLDFTGLKIDTGLWLYGDSGAATYKLIGFDITTSPVANVVSIGSTAVPTYMRGQYIYLAASGAGGICECDCDGGFIISQLSGVGSEIAMTIQDRSLSPVVFARFRTLLDGTGFPLETVGLNMYSELNMHGQVVRNVVNFYAGSDAFHPAFFNFYGDPTAVQGDVIFEINDGQPTNLFQITDSGGVSGGSTLAYFGSVGINTAMPAETLDVNGTSIFRDDLAMDSNYITGLADGVNPQDAVTVSQLTSATTGLTQKPTARLATNAALPSNTYSNGTLGVGATITVPKKKIKNTIPSY